MTYDRCPICNEWTFTLGNPHKCKPFWLCRMDFEEPGYEHKEFAERADWAATRFAEWWCNQAATWEHFPRTVIVIDPRLNRQYTYAVELEMVPEFTAHMQREEKFILVEEEV